MQKTKETIEQICDESDVFEGLLDLNHSHILELGCGKAMLTRKIAEGGPNRKVTASEVDRIQHGKNLEIDDLPNVTFIQAGAQSIPLSDQCVDGVFMFKSLHHVPEDSIQQVFPEIHRVLKPGGFAYISEPLFAGEYNDLLRLFHDEEEARDRAFHAIRNAVENGSFRTEQQVFFKNKRVFDNWEDFDRQLIHATYCDHQLPEALYNQVKIRFEAHLGPQGAVFFPPNRVDLLRKV